MSLFKSSFHSSSSLVFVLNNLPGTLKAKGKPSHFFTMPSPCGLRSGCESKFIAPNAC
ncbi:hypothetical protein HanRHA438_Chr03g0129291 [Helianthus annuus]|nr:hypothetical protein HanRHA438_Chr03g0129291 [Helianthus annuus]